MAKRHLSQELVSLIHHVELNESGWWKKAFAQLIQAVLWDDSSPRTPAQVRQLVDDGFGVRVPLDVVETQLESLIGKGSVRRRGDSFVLSERCRADLCASQEKAVKQRQGCQEAFLDECKKNCPSLDAEQAWLTFSSALAEAVRVAGANFYELLSGGCLKREQDWVEQVLAKVPSDSHDGLHKTFASFFAPKNQACRQEVLRLMSAHFFAEATQLSPETLQAIEQAGRAKKVLKVVLDTNFIFSVLHLHENPANDAVLSLLSLAREGAKHIDVKLQVLPSTLMEAQTSLAAMQKKVKHFRVTRAMARAASDQPVPSVVKKFLDAAARTPGLSAEAYFKPYVEDLRTVLHAKGITILEAHPAVYNVRQDVINDVLEQTQREDAEYPEHRRKGYEKWLHDVVLWHAVNDKRSATDSPLDADYWVVSIDWRFLGFDRYKRAQKASPLPVVLYPTSLMQLAQFWVPRSEQLEASIVNSLSLPVFTQGFDIEDEQVTLKVIGALSRFENLDDLDEPSIRSIMTNRALRARLKEGVTSSDAQFELIRDEVVALHRQTMQQLRERDTALVTVKKELEQERLARIAREQELQERVRELKAASNAAEEAVTVASAKDAAAISLESENAILAERLAFTSFLLWYILLPALTGVAASIAGLAVITTLHPTLMPTATVLISGCLLLAPISISAAIAARSVSQTVALRHSKFARAFAWLGKKAVIAPVTLALTGVYQAGVWDALKASTGIGP